MRVSEIGPIATAFWRLTLALPLLLLLSRFDPAGSQLSKRPRSLRDHLDVAAPGLCLAADLTSWHLSLQMTSIANSTLLVNLAPIFVTLFSWLILRRKIRPVFVAGLAVSTAGIVVLKGGLGGLGGAIGGDGVAVVAAAFYAGYILLLERARRTYSTTTIMLWSTTSAAFCTGLVTWYVEPQLLPWTITGWLILLGLAWISHAGGQSLITFALAWLPATMSSLTLLIQPVIAALLARLLLHESLTASQIGGGLIVIVGIALARRG